MKPGTRMIASVDGIEYNVVADEQGVLRFEVNNLIREMVDQGIEGNGVGPNEMWMLFFRNKCTLDEIMEVYRMMGYSLHGFWEVFGWEENTEGKGFEPVEILLDGEEYPS